MITRGSPIKDNEGEYTPLQVCRSNAGYYIGRMYKSKEGWIEPGSRESGYFRSHEEAEKALVEGAFGRDAPENRLLYENQPNNNE